MKNKTLAELILDGVAYDRGWGVYADSLDPDASARYGQTQFENGGLLDGKIFVANGMAINDALEDWFEGCEEDPRTLGDVHMFLADHFLPIVSEQ